MTDADRYQVLIEDSPFGIFHTDDAGSCTFVNRRWCALAGIPAEQALGDGWSKALHPDDRDRVIAEWSAAISSGRSAETHFRLLDPSGAQRLVRCQVAPAQDISGRRLGWVGTLRDLSEPESAASATSQSGATTEVVTPLSRRELQVLLLLVQGQTSKEVAATLAISPRTVETHRANIMQKLGLKTLAELVRYAIRNQLIPA